MEKRISCDCDKCQSACTNKPGWFKPGEAEEVAEYLGLTIKELFDQYLAVDWFAKNKDLRIFILSPSVKEGEPGGVFPFDPDGECVFFESGKCKIHPVAPFECKEYCHDSSEKYSGRHELVAKSWIGQEKYIESLLGYKPEIPEPTIADALNLLAGLLDRYRE